jgi:hypothetical protein
METQIELITDRQRLKSACYVEFLPGEHACGCGRSDSAFLDEAVFDLIEPAFSKHVDRFDHYGATPIDRDLWEKILRELCFTKEAIEKGYGLPKAWGNTALMLGISDRAYAEDPGANGTALMDVIERLSGWVRKRLEDVDVITVVGM